MTLYIVRHARAGKRDPTNPLDDCRDLDDRGAGQAAAVAEHLARMPICVIRSSPLPRCTQTVQPLADALGLEVVIEPRLAEGSPIQDSWAVLEQLKDTNAVLCSHGDVIPELVRRNQLRGMHVFGTAGFRKGSVWTLEQWTGTHFAKGTFHDLRR